MKRKKERRKERKKGRKKERKTGILFLSEMILMRLISIKTNKQTKQTKQQQQQNCLISNGCYLISDNFDFQHEILLRPPLNGYRTKLQSATYICFSHAQSATQYTRKGKGGKKVHFLVQRTSSA